MDWPDLVIVVVLALGTIAGLRRGLIGELTGALALAAAVAAGFSYAGGLDGFIRDRTHLGTGSAHVVGLLLFALLAYGIVLGIGLVLSTFAKLPVLNIVNAAGGAAIGFCKSLLFAWIAVYVALFFPLPQDVRTDLQRSFLVGMFQGPSLSVDDRVRSQLPWYLQPAASMLFDRHRICDSTGPCNGTVSP